MIRDGEACIDGSVSVPLISASELLAMRIGDAISALIRTPHSDRIVARGDRLATRLRNRLNGLLRRACGESNADALKDMHQVLFALYNLHVADPARDVVVNQFDPLLVEWRGLIERHWIDAECQRIGAVPSFSSADELIEGIRCVVRAHPASRHPLFEALADTATRAQFEGFFRSDTALNVRFFDLIVMAMIGSHPEARKELASNFWDEVGRGDPQRSHVRLFRHLLADIGVAETNDDFASELTWQGLRGYNLFMLCAVNRQHYFKLLGVMAATELLDPPQYRKLIVGCRRLGLGPVTTQYYDEHITVDDVHGDGWLENVIRPLAKREPRAMSEVWLGCMLRLASCNDYYGALSQQLSLAAGITGGQAEDNDGNDQRKERDRKAKHTHEGAG